MFARWAGRFLSGEITEDDMPCDVGIIDGNTLIVEPDPFVRFDFIRLEGQTYLYAGGEEYKISLALAKQLTTKSRLRLSLANAHDTTLILKLLEKGHLLRVE